MTTFRRDPSRNVAFPHAALPARGREGRLRASDIVLGLMSVLIAIFALVFAITHLFTAA